MIQLITFLFSQPSNIPTSEVSDLKSPRQNKYVPKSIFFLKYQGKAKNF